jgi:hypothetical protein
LGSAKVSMMGSMPYKAEIPCIRGFERQPNGSATSLSISTRFCGAFIEWSFMRQLSRNESPARVRVSPLSEH